MKLSTLQKALRYYSNSAKCFDTYDVDNVFDALDECAQQKEAFAYENCYGDKVHLISTHSLLQLLNLTTYDNLGKLLKRHGVNHTLNEGYYIDDIRKSCDIDLTRANISEAFGYLSDLWSDNEENDAHNPDGTFKTNEHDKLNRLTNINSMLVDTLREALKFLESYYEVDKDFFEPEKDVTLFELIEHIKILTKGGESNE